MYGIIICQTGYFLSNMGQNSKVYSDAQKNWRTVGFKLALHVEQYRGVAEWCGGPLARRV